MYKTTSWGPICVFSGKFFFRGPFPLNESCHGEGGGSGGRPEGWGAGSHGVEESSHTTCAVFKHQRKHLEMMLPSSFSLNLAYCTRKYATKKYDFLKIMIIYSYNRTTFPRLIFAPVPILTHPSMQHGCA